MMLDDASAGQGSTNRRWPDLAGRFESNTHILPVRVYYEDTDFSGIVYHASYLRFLERGRTDSLRLAGVGQGQLHVHDDGLYFAVRRLTIDYHRPAVMDDVLEVRTHTKEVRGASVILVQKIFRGNELIVSADVCVAAISGGRPARIPEGLRQLLEGKSRD